MPNNKHLDLSQRIIIEHSLNEQQSFKAIGRKINKNCTTISKEVKNRRVFKKTGAYGKAFNDVIETVTQNPGKMNGSFPVALSDLDIVDFKVEDFNLKDYQYLPFDYKIEVAV